MWNNDTNDDSSYLMNIKYQTLCYVFYMHYLWSHLNGHIKNKLNRVIWAGEKERREKIHKRLGKRLLHIKN